MSRNLALARTIALCLSATVGACSDDGDHNAPDGSTADARAASFAKSRHARRDHAKRHHPNHGRANGGHANAGRAGYGEGGRPGCAKGGSGGLVGEGGDTEAGDGGQLSTGGTTDGGNAGTGAQSESGGSDTGGVAGSGGAGTGGLAGSGGLDEGCGIRAVGVGTSNTCALSKDGSVWCWGDNSSGQLGTGTAGGSTARPVRVTDISTAVGIATGSGTWAVHTCALLVDGRIQCWGSNQFGELGDGTNAQANTPVTVQSISNAIAVTVGEYHTCALLNSGEVLCWGANSQGTLGNGTNQDSSTPVLVSGVSDAIALSAGANHTCAVLRTGSVRCWGGNGEGKLGDGTTLSSNVPVATLGISDAIGISASRVNTCALLAGGSVQCWGANSSGQLGNGTRVGSTVPVPVSGVSTARAVSGGEPTACALNDDDSVECWGTDWTYQTSLISSQVPGLSATAVAVTDTHACALRTDCTVACWGWVGDPWSPEHAVIPARVYGLPDGVGGSIGCLYSGVYSVNYEGTTCYADGIQRCVPQCDAVCCGPNCPCLPECEPLSCNAARGVAEVRVTQTGDDFSVFATFAGQLQYFSNIYPVTERSATGFTASGETNGSYSRCGRALGSSLTGQGFATIVVDCTASLITVSGSCVDSWPDACGISINAQDSFTGSGAYQ